MDDILRQQLHRCLGVNEEVEEETDLDSSSSSSSKCELDVLDQKKQQQQQQHDTLSILLLIHINGSKCVRVDMAQGKIRHRRTLIACSAAFTPFPFPSLLLMFPAVATAAAAASAAVRDGHYETACACTLCMDAIYGTFDVHNGLP